MQPFVLVLVSCVLSAAAGQEVSDVTDIPSDHWGQLGQSENTNNAR